MDSSGRRRARGPDYITKRSLPYRLPRSRPQVAKWVASSLLSGADQIKLGFVSRATPRDVSNHVVLAMHVSVGWEGLRGYEAEGRLEGWAASGDRGGQVFSGKPPARAVTTFYNDITSEYHGLDKIELC